MTTYEVVRWESGIVPIPEAKTIAEVVPHMEARDYVIAVEDGVRRQLTDKEEHELRCLKAEIDPFPAMLWTGNFLSDCWRYARVTARVSWHLFRRTLGRIAP